MPDITTTGIWTSVEHDASGSGNDVYIDGSSTFDHFDHSTPSHSRLYTAGEVV